MTARSSSPPSMLYTLPSSSSSQDGNRHQPGNAEVPRMVATAAAPLAEPLQPSSSTSSSGNTMFHNPIPGGSPTKPIHTLDSLSNVFKPIRSLDTSPTKLSLYNPASEQPKGIDSVWGTPPARTTLQRIGSATSSTPPASQFGYTANTPSSTGLTWGSSVFSGNAVYTPPRKAGSDPLNFRSGLEPLGFTPESSPPPPPATPDELDRFLMVNNLPRNANGEYLRQIINGIAQYRAIITKHLHAKGWVIISFYDPRDAMKVYEKLNVSSIRFALGDPLVKLHCTSISPEVVRLITGSGDEWDEIWKASEATIKVQIHGPSAVSIKGMEKCLSTIGDLKSFETHGRSGKSFSAEYYDTRRAADAIRVLNNQLIEDGSLSVRYASEDPFLSEPLDGPPRLHQPPLSYTLPPAAYPGHARKTSYPALSRVADRRSPFVPSEPSSPSVRHSLSGNFQRLRIQTDPHAQPDDGGWGAVSEVFAQHEAYRTAEVAHRTPTTTVDRRLSEPGGVQGLVSQMEANARARQQHQGYPWSGGGQNERQAILPENRVYPERVLAGLDTRTTVMVKDVPNKLSRQELVNILSEVTPGEFDFVYLRFDFNNHCNVGYAFVNFTSVKALYAFIQARVGKKWNLFSSEKVLQVSYANIQGKAALVNKFRNSAVMDVIEEWRPQIFFSSGALKGQPEPFPEADNPSGRHRSSSSSHMSPFLLGSDGQQLQSPGAGAGGHGGAVAGPPSSASYAAGSTSTSRPYAF